MKDKTALTGALIIVLVLVGIGAIALILQTMNGLQETSTVLHKTKVNSEGLKVERDRFEESPLATNIALAPTMQDVITEEVPTPERSQVMKLNDEGEALLDDGKLDEAMAKYSDDIKYMDSLERKGTLAHVGRPDSVSLLRATLFAQRGYCFMKQKKLQRGIEDLTQAIHYRPQWPVNYANRAQAYRLLGREDLAIVDQTKARELDKQQ